MAEPVEVNNEPGDLEGLEKELREAVTKVQESEDKAVEQGRDPSEVEDPLKGTKFEGKSVADILESYTNLQSAYGRMANDLGTQRKLTDQLLNLKRDDDLTRNSPDLEPKTRISSEEFLENPDGVLGRYLDERDSKKDKAYEEKLQSLEASLAAREFTSKHPDYMQIGEDPKFQAWVAESASRQRVGNLAAQGDLEAADVLLTEFKDISKAAPKEEPKADLEAAKKATLESSAQGKGEQSTSKKIYRRADIMELRLRKPEVYADPAFQEEIMQAYAEGRVK